MQILTCRAWLSCCSRCRSSVLVAAWDSMRASALSASSPAPAMNAHHVSDKPGWSPAMLPDNAAGNKAGREVHKIRLTNQPCIA